MEFRALTWRVDRKRAGGQTADTACQHELASSRFYHLNVERAARRVGLHER